ncbi:MAG: hypothetical protein V4669_18935 [Pseudomonadota bacterium]
MNELIAAVVGGFLAAATGWFLQNRLEASRQKKLAQLFVIGVRDDLKASVDLYDRLMDEWEKSQTVWFTTVNELRESRQTYQKQRDWLVLLQNEGVRQKLFRYYHRSADLLTLIENQQRRKYEIQSKLTELVRDLQLRDGTLSREAAIQQAVALMHAEDQELIGINGSLPQNVQKLRDFRGEAKELLANIPERGDV